MHESRLWRRSRLSLSRGLGSVGVLPRVQGRSPHSHAVRTEGGGARATSWAALEFDDYGNDQIWGPFRLSCHAAGLKAGVWMTEGANIRLTPADADFAIAEVEGPGDYEGVVNAISDGKIPTCPKAICTNFNLPLADASGPNPQAAKPLIDAGFACLTEAYIGDNPSATPTNMDFRGGSAGGRRPLPSSASTTPPSPPILPTWRRSPGGAAISLSTSCDRQAASRCWSGRPSASEATTKGWLEKPVGSGTEWDDAMAALDKLEKDLAAKPGVGQCRSYHQAGSVLAGHAADAQHGRHPSLPGRRSGLGIGDPDVRARGV